MLLLKASAAIFSNVSYMRSYIFSKLHETHYMGLGHDLEWKHGYIGMGLSNTAYYPAQ